jgi:hypothetical protein
LDEGANTREAEGAEGESFRDLFVRLIADVRTLIGAELDLYRSLAIQRFIGSRRVVIFATAGAVLIAGSAIALLLGIVLALARFVGPLGAGLIVFVVGMGLGILCLRLAIRCFQRAGELSESDAP